MLQNINSKSFPFQESDLSIKDLNKKMSLLQREYIMKNIPVIFVIDGWESSGRGYCVNRLVKKLDTKHYRVSIFTKEKQENFCFFTKQNWKNLPANGDFAFFVRSYYDLLFNNCKLGQRELEDAIEKIKDFEGLVQADGCLILKFFLHQSLEEQEEAIRDLFSREYEEVLVDKKDKHQNKNYQDYLRHMDLVLEKSNFSSASWQVIPSGNRKAMTKEILLRSIQALEEHLMHWDQKEEKEFEKLHSPKYLEKLDLTKSIEKKEYKIKKEELQKQARKLSFALYANQVPSIIVFEGNDASGKGGCIDRLVAEMDARSYHINPTSAPNDQEKDHHYLWRFYNNLPKKGQLAIFDRSWYGRVLVERIEGFAQEEEWRRAYDEINRMEEVLAKDGYLIMKFLLSTSKEEQKRRFTAREEEKPYKITDEDWRNREKWDDYELAMNDMLALTNTDYAPWFLISSEQKEWARIQVLKHYVEEVEKFIHKHVWMK